MQVSASVMLYCTANSKRMAKKIYLIGHQTVISVRRRSPYQVMCLRGGSGTPTLKFDMGERRGEKE